MSSHRLDVYLHEGTGTVSTSVESEDKKQNKTKVYDHNTKMIETIRNGVGKSIVVGSLANGIVGEYTEDRLLERRNNFGLKVIGFTGALATANPLIIAGAVGYLGVRETKRRIKINKENFKSSILRKLSGDTVNSGSRWRGSR